MKTKSEHFSNKSAENRRKERGNALIYVLIAIVLFAALSYTLARNTDTSEAGTLSADQAELYASQLISYSAQAKSVVDQMLFTGAQINDLDFTLPSEATFETPPNIYKVYHPDGGGLNLGTLSDTAKNEISTSPVAGWYLGRFNNVEWSATTNQDVILVAYQIDKTICENINEKVTGSTAIPALTTDMRLPLIDDSNYSGTNADLTSVNCAGCVDQMSLCVQNSSGTAYSFYTVLADQ